MQSEQKSRHDPIRVPVRTPMLDSYHCERFPKIALQRHAMEECGVIRGRIMCRIVEWGKIVFEVTTNPQASILEGRVEISHHLVASAG